MNKTFCFTLVLFLRFISFAQEPAILKKEEPLELQVMLQDNLKDVQLPAYCGLVISDAILNYKVIKVIHGFYLGNVVRIHMHCLREHVEDKSIANHVTYVYKLKPIKTTNDKPVTYEITI